MNKLREILFWNCTNSWDSNIAVSVRIDFDNFYLKIFEIVLSLVGQSTIMTLRFNKLKMFKRFICNLLKANIKFESTCLYGVGRVNWKIINWSHWIYYGPVSKVTWNNPNHLGMYLVSIRNFHSVLGWYKQRKVWHLLCECNIRSTIFMKQHSREYIKFLRRGEHQSSLKHCEVKIQKIFIIFFVW